VNSAKVRIVPQRAVRFVERHFALLDAFGEDLHGNVVVDVSLFPVVDQWFQTEGASPVLFRD